MGFVKLDLDELTHNRVKAAAALGGVSISEFVAKHASEAADAILPTTSVQPPTQNDRQHSLNPTRHDPIPHHEESS